MDKIWVIPIFSYTPNFITIGDGSGWDHWGDEWDDWKNESDWYNWGDDWDDWKNQSEWDNWADGWDDWADGWDDWEDEWGNWGGGGGWNLGDSYDKDHKDYHRCGWRYGCFGYPKNCVDHKNCTILVTYRQKKMNGDVKFTLKASEMTNRYTVFKNSNL